MEALVSSAARAQAAVASADDSQARLTPKTPQTPKSVGFVSLVLFVITHTHSFNGPFSGTNRVSQYQKGKTNLSLKQETVSGSGISWAICKSTSCSRQITMPVPHYSVFFTGRMPFLSPNQQRQSTEGRYYSLLLTVYIFNCRVLYGWKFIYFASAAVAVDSSGMTASSSASWSRFSPPSNFVNGHVSTMLFMVCHWPQSQEGDWFRLHLCKLAWRRPIGWKVKGHTVRLAYTVFNCNCYYTRLTPSFPGQPG